MLQLLQAMTNIIACNCALEQDHEKAAASLACVFIPVWHRGVNM
jgi:hypothetical protein